MYVIFICILVTLSSSCFLSLSVARSFLPLYHSFFLLVILFFSFVFAPSLWLSLVRFSLPLFFLPLHRSSSLWLSHLFSLSLLFFSFCQLLPLFSLTVASWPFLRKWLKLLHCSDSVWPALHLGDGYRSCLLSGCFWFFSLSLALTFHLFSDFDTDNYTLPLSQL